ncbi:hypothetical protein KC368_g42 [Hortaea werneckii]|nr:hypothetical protein KC368_g42 [Hortaea werneckii]
MNCRRPSAPTSISYSICVDHPLTVVTPKPRVKVPAKRDNSDCTPSLASLRTSSASCFAVALILACAKRIHDAPLRHNYVGTLEIG